MFSLPNTPTAQDTSSQTHALAIEALLGGPDHMAARVGICANASMVAAQMLRVKETWPQDVWARTGRVQLASAFLASLISGKWTSMGETEACASGAWVHSANQLATPIGQGYWDEGVLDIIGGSREEGRRVRGWLGDVDVSGGSRRSGNVSRYLVERYGFDSETIVAPFTTDFFASYLSLLPSSGDAVLSFGPIDTVLTPAQHYLPTRFYNIFPHPAQDATEKRKYIAVLSSRNADVPRALVRDMYTKSWSAFDRLVAIVPPGGSIGLDDKLFSFWHLQPDSFPFTRVKGIYRFETGVKVNEFRDLRANPRCLVESQLLSFRVKWSKMISAGVLGTRKAGVSSTPPLSSTRSAGGLGVHFDPYDHTPLPARILAIGAAANFPSIANLVGDMFNSPVFLPFTQIDSAQIVPHRNAPAQGYPSRASIGSAFVARWIWSREWGTGALGVFEDEIKRLLGKRWIATGGALLRSNVNGVTSVIRQAPGSGTNSGTSTPFGHAGSRASMLGNTVFAEEEEDEVLEMERNGKENMLGPSSPGIMSSGGLFANAEFIDRVRSQSGTTIDSLSSGASSSLLTTPDLSLGNFGVITSGTSSSVSSSGANGGAGAGTPTTSNPLTPVVALPTADTEAQVGFAKVAEPDFDAFMTYAAILSEFCRLETMVVKGIV